MPHAVPRTRVDSSGGPVSGRDFHAAAESQPPPPHAANHLVLQTPPNWTAVVFFACLAFLHSCIAIPAFLNRRWEGYLSCALAIIFFTVSVVSYFVRFELMIQTRERRLRLRSGTRGVAYQRYIPFCDVHGVRLTMLTAPDYPLARIEVLCDNEDIECPTTDVPRQQALCLAMLMDVQLIKVCSDDPAADLTRSADASSHLEHAPRL
jgi:hypothetical protein